MWRLDKPSLQKAKDDLNNIVAHCRAIDNADKIAFENLYDEYDRKGYISEEYHLSFSSAHPAQVKAMYGQYKKLGDKQEYGYIREELSEAADTCPYCGFGEPVTLDHYMPESIYKELATCRLNLVPICWKCNNKKLDNDYQGFSHVYYQDFPKGVIFFKCKVVANASGFISFDFYIDGRNLDSSLVEKLENQIEVIELSKRLNKECITFITSNFVIESLVNNEALKFFISDRLKKATDYYGNNDWHTALLQGLYDCKEFDIVCLKKFIGKNKRKVLV